MEVLQGHMGSWEIFWVLFYGFATYGNAGYMREQVCKYMCPYARFQSAMFDRDTLIVSYDEQRGEPRGGRSRKADPEALGLGACVDCSLCVQVCPTGIDIRKGLQYECISCASCIDVCDDVMDKMNYPRGLIRYTTENALEQGWKQGQIWGHILRPRVLVYASILGAVVIAMLVSLAMRVPFKVDVVRDRGVLARIAAGGRIENVYRLQIMNATEKEQSFHIEASGLPGLTVASESDVIVAPAEARWVAVRLQVPYEGAVPGSQAIRFDVAAPGLNGRTLHEKSTFLVPR